MKKTREKKAKVILSVRVAPEVFDTLENYAIEEEASVSEITSEILELALGLEKSSDLRIKRRGGKQ